MENKFSGIYGQAHATDTLFRMYLSGRIPHALMFSGPEGVGKHYVAIRFAQLLNSERPDNGLFAAAEDVSPENDPVLKKVASLQEPYIKYIIPLPRGKNETSDSAPTEKLSAETLELLREEISKKSANPYHKVSIPDANTIKITSIRDIKRFISYSFDELKYRIILISDAHLMNDEAQNTLLKSLEEPPEGVIFILCTDKKDRLLETIRSRCWIVNFEPLLNNELQEVLISHFGVEVQIASGIVPFANGSVTSALELLKYDFDELQKRTINILRYAIALKYHSAVKEMSTVLEDSSGQTLRLTIDLMNYWISDLQKNKYNTGSYFFSRFSETIEKFNLKFPGADMLKVSDRLDRLAKTIDNNVNLNLLALNVIFELASLRYSDK